MSMQRDVSVLSPNRLARRSFLATAAAAAASTALGRDYGPGAQPVRYPDPDIVTLDKRFSKYALGNTPVQRLYHSPNMLWAEGTAPPSARPEVLLVSEDGQVVRGGGRFGGSNANLILMGGLVLVAGVIGGVIGYNIKDDAS